MNVLITGDKGFIGKSVCALCSEFGINPISLPNEAIPLESASDSSFLKEIDGVIHLVGKAKGSEIELINSNLLSTARLLSMLEQKESKRVPFVYASTFSVYKPQDSLINEDSIVGPENIYGITKKWAEELIYLYSKKGIINASILRLSNVYGPAMPPFSHSVVATFIKQISEGTTLTINGDGNQERDFIYVDDAAKALLNAVAKRSSSDYEVFTIASGVKTSLNDLVKNIEKILNKKAIVSYNNQYSEKGIWIGDSSKAKKVLDWSAETVIEDGMRKTIN